jgi:DNA repair protein RadC
VRTQDVPRLIAKMDPSCLTGEGGGAAPIDRRELAWCIAFDEDGNIASCERIAEGTRNRVNVPLPRMLAVPIRRGVQRLALVHSHPGGSLHVSAEDRDLTRSAVEAAATCGMILTDSYIITPNGQARSLVEAGVLAPLPLLRVSRTSSTIAAN